RAAALAGAEALLLGGGRGAEELDVGALGRHRRAARPAVDAGRADRGVEPAVEAGVAALRGPVAALRVERGGGRRRGHAPHHARAAATGLAGIGRRRRGRRARASDAACGPVVRRRARARRAPRWPATRPTATAARWSR